MKLTILAPLAALSLIAAPSVVLAKKPAPKHAKHMKAPKAAKTTKTTTDTKTSM